MLCIVRIDDTDPEVVKRKVAYLLEGIVGANRLIMLEQAIPPLYRSGIRYQVEPWSEQAQSYSDCLEIIGRRWTECKGATAWRLAELRNAARSEDEALKYSIHVSHKELAPGRLLFHVKIRLPDGSFECHDQ